VSGFTRWRRDGSTCNVYIGRLLVQTDALHDARLKSAGHPALSVEHSHDNSDYSVTFIPDEPLQYGATYTVTVEEQLDQALGTGDGEDLQQVPFEWSFTTEWFRIYLTLVFKQVFAR
jgi:hypothetical protein